MRTTLNIDDNGLETTWSIAEAGNQSAGMALPDLARTVASGNLRAQAQEEVPEFEDSSDSAVPTLDRVDGC